MGRKMSEIGGGTRTTRKVSMARRPSWRSLFVAVYGGPEAAVRPARKGGAGFTLFFGGLSIAMNECFW